MTETTRNTQTGAATATTTVTATTSTPPKFPARGKVLVVRDGLVVFQPSVTNYELHLLTAGQTAAPGTLVDGLVRVVARKILTVPSGGNFIAPIFGSPRTVQGRVRSLDERGMVVHAGTPVYVEFPANDSAFDLNSGPIAVGSMVNVTALPGARFELIGPARGGASPTTDTVQSTTVAADLPSNPRGM